MHVEAGVQGGGIDGAVQRFALTGLNGAACELHTTREELVLSFVPVGGRRQRARGTGRRSSARCRSGFDKAAEDLAGDGLAGRLLKLAIDRLVSPSLAWFLDEST